MSDPGTTDAFQDYLDASHLLDELTRPVLEAEEAELAALVESAGVQARIRVRACPLILTGTIDGRSFYLRDRHGTYRLSVPAGTAQVDLYDDPAAADRVLEEGPGDLAPAEALRIAIQSLRRP